MSSTKTRCFWLAAQTSLPQIIETTEYSFSASPPTALPTKTLLDTFDGRLHQRGWYADLTENTLTLFTGTGTLSQPAPAAPFRIEHLPTGEVADRLARVIKIRALMPVAQYRETRTEFRVLDDLQKTVVRLFEHTIIPNVPDAPVLHRLEVRPVRGYDKANAAVVHALTEHGAIPADPWQDDIIRACGNRPEGYSSKITVQLNPEMLAVDAAKTLLAFIFESMTTNAPYISQDIDTEFLHDFRVAVRRTRAALGQIKGVFSPEISTKFKHEFSLLGKSTNSLRDLDVYLLSADSYRAMLPAHMRPAIEPLFAHLASRREAALAEAVAALESPRTVQLMEDWAEFLSTPSDTAPPNATQKVIDLAQKRIFGQYRKIVKMGRHLLKHPNDAELHQLRLASKKLRYLLEFFSSLFPPKAMKRLIKQLKIVQDNLGAFNDLTVQEAFLLDTALHRPPKTPWPPETTLAIGALIGIFDARKSQVKTEFAAIFRDFSAPKNEALFKQLFSPQKDGPA